MTHGGARPNAGRPPNNGVRMWERIELRMTEAERAEIEGAAPDGHPVGRWIVAAALEKARRG
jgi:uncharacterized protein (DUF1778 family)